MRVLVTDGDQRSALAVTRALGQQHIQVVVGAETTSSLAATSRYCSRSFAYPSPYADPEGFVSRLLELVKHIHIAAVFPISDVAMRLIGAAKQQFDQWTAAPIPPISVFEEISDKYHLMKLALELQVPIPETIFVPNGHVEEVIHGISRFPVVVKPGCSLVKKNGQWSKTSVHVAPNAEEVFRLYRERDYLQHPSLIQQRVEGEGQGLFVLMDHGEPVTLFAHRRLREQPPSGGVSVLRESIGLPKPMTDYALRLLQHIGWHGVAMVEFKIDRQSEVPLLMEVNGRFWGSLQLALDAGVNFPYLLYQMATGQPLNTPTNGYRIGVKSRWLLGDLDHLLLRFSRSKQGLYLPPNSSSKWQCLQDFCRFFQIGTYYEVESFDDPGPSVYEVRNYMRNLLRIGRIADGMQQLAGSVRRTLRSLFQLTVKFYNSLRFF